MKAKFYVIVNFVAFFMFVVPDISPGILAALNNSSANTTTVSQNAPVAGNASQEVNHTNQSSQLDGNQTDKVIKILPDTSFDWKEHRNILPCDYAQVTTQPAPVFKGAWSSLKEKKPVRYLDGGFIWVSLESPMAINSGNFTWYYINQNEFIQADYLSFFQVSTFKGINTKELPLNGSYGWLVLDTYTSRTPGKQEYIDGELIEKHTLVKIADIKFVNGQKWLKLATNKWIDGRRIALITHPQRPSKVPAKAKWIDINLYEQVLEAFEGDRLVYATLISSGLPEFETPTGLFRIWGKVRMAKMSGGEKGEDYYFLEDVPYHMYFSAGVAMHGAYWHDNFGMKQSHGCVNLAPRDAYWLFNWTLPKTSNKRFIKSSRSNPGTYVYVHY